MKKMAAFRIHEDQENFGAREMRSKNVAPMDVGQPKRSVLGVLDNKLERGLHEKQPLKQQLKPSVPVAQFQAFNVYEINDKIENELRERQRKNKKDDLSSLYTGTEKDRLLTKREAEEKLQEAAKALQSITTADENKVCPMSVEKPHEPDTALAIAQSKTSRDAFFEMEEYRDHIFQYLKQQERLNRPKPMYMKKQPDISYSMRAILIDWLVEVTEEYKLHTETLYLAVNYIDRFLSFMSVLRAKLQLLGTAAMFIASKYEEIYPPDVREFVYITDDTYTKRQIIRMEMLILRVLDFDLSIPTTYTFITAICISNQLHERVMYLALYVSELSLLEAEPCLETLPSQMASACIALGRFYNDEEMWTEELAASTGYQLDELATTVKFLNELLEKAPKMQQQSIQEKYLNKKFLKISEVQVRPLEDHDFF